MTPGAQLHRVPGVMRLAQPLTMLISRPGT